VRSSIPIAVDDHQLEGTSMRISVLIVLTLLTSAASVPRPAAAAYNLPWCAQYDDGSNIISCAFYTFEQCMATISGIGGLCRQNWRLPPPPAAYYEPQRTKRRQTGREKHPHHTFTPAASKSARAFGSNQTAVARVGHRQAGLFEAIVHLRSKFGDGHRIDGRTVAQR
jgi:hypothetical protein